MRRKFHQRLATAEPREEPRALLQTLQEILPIEARVAATRGRGPRRAAEVVSLRRVRHCLQVQAVAARAPREEAHGGSQLRVQRVRQALQDEERSLHARAEYPRRRPRGGVRRVRQDLPELVRPEEAPQLRAQRSPFLLPRVQEETGD